MLNTFYRKTFGTAINVRNVVVVLLSALFFSCEDPIGIAVDLPSGGTLSTIFSDTISISRSTIKLDSAVTSGTSFGVIGSYTDPDFGKVSAETYTNFQLPIRTFTDGTIDFYDFDLGKNAVYDSLVMILVPISFSYGKDTLRKSNLSIHLLDNVIANKRHNSFETATYQATPIASRDINLKDLRRKSGADSSIRFKLSDDLGKRIFAIQGTTTIKKTISGTEESVGDNTKLAAAVKGLAIKMEAGIDVLYSLSLPQCSFIMYYHTVDAAGATELTNGVGTKTFPFDLASVYFTSYKTDYKGKAFEKITTDLAGISSTQTKGLSYIQNGTGVVTKINIPFLNNTANSKLAVNKAEIVITPMKSDFYSFPTAIGLAEINEKNQIVRTSGVDEYVILDNSQTAATIDTSKKYTLNVTSYLQSYLTKKTKNQLAIIPYNYFINSAGTASFIANTDTRRLILDEKSVKLRIYYSSDKK